MDKIRRVGGNGPVTDDFMTEVELKVRRLKGHEDLPLPAYETEGSAGLDLRAAVREGVMLRPGEIRLIPTGSPSPYPAGSRLRSDPAAVWHSSTGWAW